MRFLVADDAAVAREVFGHLARELGHEVAGAAIDAEATVRALRELQVDAVVLDGRLPPQGALGVIPLLRAAAPDVAILIVAALGETDLVRAAVAAGADGALRRPLTLLRLSAALESVQRSHGTRR